MGLGFVFMYFASLESSVYGKSTMYWLVLAYLFHTIGELRFTNHFILYYKAFTKKISC